MAFGLLAWVVALGHIKVSKLIGTSRSVGTLKGI